MTRPQIIRADTLDLQDRTSPTAQDHSRQPQHPAPLGVGPAAPHQEASLRQVDNERQHEEANLQNASWNDDAAYDDDRPLTNGVNGINGVNGTHHLQQDEQAVRLNGGMSGSGDDSDLQDAEGDEDMDDDMMDKISSSPSILDEDIDFEFVYALHTFVATVEGQANATKGDNMVLLDDSNSYWWLVRVAKDSSIGYLPAEHIETPTERLARLNKHRNIDLSATMLGDTAEKTKNPLRKAIRRRNAKTVTFAPPTYYEASDYDYSSDEGEDDELFGGADPNQAQAQGSAEKEVGQDETLKVEPLKLGSNKDANASSSGSTSQAPEANKANGDTSRTSDDLDRPLDPKVSRNGTLRNTDSFFKDDNAETRKITLTPNLLRDDSTSSAARERGPSLESLEKGGFADKVKDDKKKKDKKPGMLSGLFKRKDKKAKGVLESFDSGEEKQSGEYGRSSPQPKESSEERPSTDNSASPQRQPSKGKLQKPQRGREESPSKLKGILKTDDVDPLNVVKESATNKPATSQATTMRVVSPEQQNARVSSEQQSARVSSDRQRAPLPGTRSQQPAEAARPEEVKSAKQRMQLDDFDSEEEPKDPFADSASAEQTTTPMAAAQPSERLSESPVQISAADAQPPATTVSQSKESLHEPDLTADTSSQDSRSPVSTPSPNGSPSTHEPPKPNHLAADPATASSNSVSAPSRPAPVPAEDMATTPTSPSASKAASLPAWSDVSLRTYLDDGSEIRDTLMVINDTTGVVPVGRDHPLMARLFVEEKKAVTQLGGQLDMLLTNWIESKRRKQRTVASKA